MCDAEGGVVAGWSKALLLREKINKNQKITGTPPDLGKLKKLDDATNRTRIGNVLERNYVELAIPNSWIAC